MKCNTVLVFGIFKTRNQQHTKRNKKLAFYLDFGKLAEMFINNRFTDWKQRKSDAFHTIYEQTQIEVFLLSVDTPKVIKRILCVCVWRKWKKFHCLGDENSFHFKKRRKMVWSRWYFEPYKTMWPFSVFSWWMFWLSFLSTLKRFVLEFLWFIHKFEQL